MKRKHRHFKFMLFALITALSQVSLAEHTEHYKSDPMWELVWQDWCMGKKNGIYGKELETVKYISSKISIEAKAGSCLKQQEYLKYDLSYLMISGKKLSDYSPLISLLDAKNLKTLNLRRTKPSQNELNKLGFLELSKSFEGLYLPYSLEDDRPPICPFSNSLKCF